MDITVLATLISAGATAVIACLTVPTIKAYNKQIQIGQNQVMTTQVQTYNQLRPVLVPPSLNGSPLLRIDQGRPDVQWGQGQVAIDGLQNIGVGPAFNIYGIFFGPPFQNQPPHNQRYCVWNYGVLSAGATGEKIKLSQGSSIKSTTIIGGHGLYVPDDENHLGRIVRFTVTYHDIFGRKFASIYDYQNVLGWMCVGHFEDIEMDIYELDQQDPMTQQSNRMFYAMSKNK
jgi:hypothetical protein